MARNVRGRYARLPLGIVDRLLESGISLEGAMLYVRLRTHPAKRTIPGLLHVGIAGLAESLGEDDTERTSQLLRELEPRFIVRDPKARLIYCLGAIQEDPPTTWQSTTAIARQWSEIPTASPLRCLIRDAVVESFTDDVRREKLPQVWQEELAKLGAAEADSQTESTSESAPESAPASAPESPVFRDPEPVAAIRNPLPQTLEQRSGSVKSSALRARRSASSNQQPESLESIAAEVLLVMGPLPADILRDQVGSVCGERGVKYDGKGIDAAIAAAEGRASEALRGAIAS